MCGSRTTRKHPLQLKKKSRRGEIQKNKAKGFSGGASGRVRPQALGLSLHGSAAITLEIGSRFFVERSQEKCPSLQAWTFFLLEMGDENPGVCQSKLQIGFGEAQ